MEDGHADGHTGDILNRGTWEISAESMRGTV